MEIHSSGAFVDPKRRRLDHGVLLSPDQGRATGRLHGPTSLGSVLRGRQSVFHSSAWGCVVDIHTQVGTVCRGSGLGPLCLSAVLECWVFTHFCTGTL